MALSPSRNNAVRVPGTQIVPEVNLTAKDGLFIATECHLALFPDEDGDTALHLAVVQGDVEACKKLLELFHIAGKSIDVHNKLLQTPLHVAVITNHKDIVKLLIRHGSDPNNPDRYGSTAYHLCAKYDHPECLQEILQNIGTRVPDLNTRDYEGLTALHVAVINGSVQTFKMLVANRADIDAKDNKGGRTPLIYAIEANERAIVELLLECDASVSQQTYSGDTALHIASGRGLQDIVRLLLRRGADATMKNTHCETPMSLATSPSVSDILKMQYGRTASPETKAHTAADSQFANYVARNVAVPMPPHFLFGLSADDKAANAGPNKDQTRTQKRGRILKTEHVGFDSDEAIPAKRPAVGTLSSFPIVVPVPPLHTHKSPSKGENNPGAQNLAVKCEYVEKRPSQPNQITDQIEDINPSHTSSKTLEMKDDYTIKQDSESCEVEIAVEEVEVSAEEVVQSKSDDEEKITENHPLSVQDDRPVTWGSSASDKRKPTYTHKLMMYSTNNSNKSNQETNADNAQKFASNSSKEIENKAVIVERQPQIDVATALSREYRTNYAPNPTYKSFTPSVSPMLLSSTQAPVKSKSVPNSPQPLEANLYQLAREGLAVAAMANSSNSYNSSGREFGITSYLRARPSRQAKIKSGTEELQNLALQGLAVAAMNAQSELFQNNNPKKKIKSAEDGDILSSVTTVPKHLSQVLNPVKDGLVPPQLQRSNSMPPKQYYERESGQEPFSKSHLSSNRALLALAHANARKEHVGQAVSAISMGRMQSTSTQKYQPVVADAGGTSNDVSESTKLNLRQAIMVKNTNSNSGDQKLQKVEVYDPKARKFQTFDTNNPPTKKYNSKSNEATTKNISIKIVPTSGKGKIFSDRFPKLDSAGFVTTSNLKQSSPTEISRPKSPVLSKVLNISISKEAEKSPPDFPSQNAGESDAGCERLSPCGNRSPQGKSIAVASHTKTAKDTAPTNTVAPLQMVNNKGIPLLSRKSEQQTLISVAMAPIVASRVSSPASSLQYPSETRKAVTESSASSATETQSLLTVPPNSIVAGAVTPIPHVAIGLQPQQVISPALTNLGLVGPSGGAPYLQPQFAYVPHGKDLIPVIVPHAFHTQVQFPQYATALHVQASQSTSVSGTSSAPNITSANGVQLSQAYLNSMAANILPRMPALTAQDAQIRGMYPIPTPIYGNQSLDLFQQQQYLKNTLVYQQQQSLHRVGTATVAATSKPVAAVSAVPAQKVTQSSDSNKSAVLSADEQPLNLSTRSADQPLNLMKSNSVSQATPKRETSIRSSVIKAVSSVQNEEPKSTAGNISTNTTGNQRAAPVTGVLASFGDQQVRTGVVLPPPLIIPGAVPQTPSAALSSLSLPPIHYVNGMPFIYGVQPQI